MGSNVLFDIIQQVLQRDLLLKLIKIVKDNLESLLQVMAGLVTVGNFYT